MKTKLFFAFRICKAILILLLISFACLRANAQAPVNDLCGGATVLVSSTNPTPTITTLTNATLSAPALGTACGTEGADVWYSFVAKSKYPFINLSTAGSNLSTNNVSIQLFSGTCGALTNLACISGMSFRTAALYTTGLVINQTYYIRVYSSDPAPVGLNWDFSIAVTDPPANDECSTATALTPGVNPGATAGTFSNANIATTVLPVCGAPDAGADVWYSFTATTAFPFINISGTGTNITAIDTRIQLFSGTCGSLTNLVCTSGYTLNTATLYPSGLTIGQVYYIRLANINTAPTGANWGFSVAVISSSPNDLCANATTLTPGVNPTAVTGTLNNATLSSPSIPTACSMETPDAWYTFQATTVYPSIVLSSTGANFGTNGRIQLFSGSCGSLTNLACVTGNSLSTLTAAAPLTVGSFYYVRVYSNNAAPAGTGWNFGISVLDAPVNDLCANAITLTPGINPAVVTGTLNNATLTAPAISTSCGTETPDVWYMFQAGSVYPSIALTSTGASLGTNGRIQLFSGSCGSFTNMACATGNTLSTLATGAPLTIGNYYYVRVYSNNASPAGAGWNFGISVADGPSNDLCANAVTLVSAASPVLTAGTLNNASVSSPAITTACGTAGADVWYTFQANSAYPNILLTTTGGTLGANGRIQLFSGTCGSLTNIACAAGNTLNTTTTATPLTVGAYYYVRVYSNTIAPTGTGLNFSISVTDIASNDACAGASNLVSAVSPVPVAGTLNGATISSPSIPTTCSTEGGDVWYTFTAASTYPTILLSSTGTSLGTTNAQIQLFSGACGSLVSLGCAPGNQFSSAFSSSTPLTIGNVYYIRIYSAAIAPVGPTWGYSIAVADQPLNDDCTGAILLTSSTTCNNVTSTVVNATPSIGVPAACSGTVKYDVWYTFVAQTTNPTIKLSNIGAAFSAQTPRIQLFSGNCGSLVSVGCGTSTYAPTGLTVGASYYFRVYSITGSAVPNSTGNFDICIQDPVPPANDNCAGAVSLTSAATCSSVAGTLLNSTSTTGIPGDCGDPNSPEVWYSFVANSLYPNITLGSVGAQFSAAGPRIQLLAGTCGSFTSLACVSGTSVNSFLASGGVGLTIGNTYYIRIYTNTAIMSGTTWGFTICVTDPPAPVLDYGKSYVNITKGSGGGTIEPGDELEMRATILVKSSSTYNTSFTGSIPANTSYVPGTMRILTNEGKIYKQWTDAADGDPAVISGPTVTINLGNGATGTLGGAIKSSDRPTAGGGCMIIVSYHVKVKAVSFGSLVSVGGGTVSYVDASGNATNITFPAVTAMVYQNYGICANTIGSNGILSENGGTFGSGNTKDRAPSANIPANYTYQLFTTGQPGDYHYGMSNNTSASTTAANYSIDPNDPVSAHRVFGVWDIIGDHTGAADPLAGNLPADVNNGQNGGYMAVINAAYRTDTAFLDTVRNLCPNTSYEYSAWFRNICRKCGIDSVGAGPSSGSYVPTGPGDSSGVHPNLTFNINGYDYYTTGDMAYTGQWVKKGFTYRTGPTETQMIINIRNNAPGGGGNDWAIDDIGVASCSPNLDVNPGTPTLNVCYGDGASLSAQIRSYFDNYTYYVWEKSIDSGATYTATAYFSNGTATPVFNGTEYEYTATGPSFIGDSTTHDNIFRLRVATTASNLADTNCSFLATRLVQVYVHNCMWLLKTDLLNVAGALQDKLSVIQWETSNESGKISFEIEKSADGNYFMPIGKLDATAGTGNGSYKFTDPTALAGIGYYRIKMIGETGFKYSKIIVLSPGQLHFSLQNLLNPFTGSVSFNVILPADGTIRATIFDMFGRTIKTYRQPAQKGVMPIKMQDLNGFGGGTYFLKVEWQNESIIKKIIKTN
jgi:hypothetical protein